MTTQKVSNDTNLFLLPVEKADSRGNVSKDKNANFQDVMNGSMNDKKKDTSITKKTPKTEQKAETAEKNDVVFKPDKREEAVNQTPEQDVQKSPEDILKDKIQEMVQQVKDALKSNMSISDKQLEEIMASLGMNPTDLLDLMQVKKIILQVYGASDLSSALTDESLAKTIQDFTKLFQDLNPEEEQGLTKEQMISLMEQAAEEQSQETVNPDQIIKDTKGQTENIIKPGEQQDLTKQIPDTGKEETQAADSEVKVTVVKEGMADNRETNTSSEHHDKGQHKETQASGQNQLNDLMNHFSQTVTTTTDSFDGQIVQVKEMRNIVNQIVEQIKVVIKPGVTSMEFQLNPESLGKVHLTVTAKEGIMTAQFAVQNEAAKEAIQSQMQVLRESLEQQGLKVDAIEVTVSNFSFDQKSSEADSEGQEKNSRERTRRKIDLDDLENPDDISEEEEIMIDMMEKDGNRVNYMA